jgi:hypothetical protein
VNIHQKVFRERARMVKMTFLNPIINQQQILFPEHIFKASSGGKLKL